MRFNDTTGQPGELGKLIGECEHSDRLSLMLIIRSESNVVPSDWASTGLLEGDQFS